MSIERANEREGQEHETPEVEAPVQKQTAQKAQFKTDGPLPPVGGKFGALHGTADAAFQAKPVQFDKGAKIKAENEKLQDASDADRTKQHADADLGSAQGMGAAIDRVTFRMLAFDPFFKERKSVNPGDRGFGPIIDEIKKEAHAIKWDIEQLSGMIGNLATNGKMEGNHAIFAANLHQFKYAYSSYRAAFYAAEQFAKSNQDTWEEKANALDDFGFPDTLNRIFTPFGLTFQGTDGRATKVDVKAKDPKAGPTAKETADAFHEEAESHAADSVSTNAGAATKAAHAIRMEVKKGDANRKVDMSHLYNALEEVSQGLAELDPKHLKQVKPTLQALVAELDALEPALDQWHKDEKERVFGSGGKTGGYVQKVRAAAK
jgi:hypothetical protein